MDEDEFLAYVEDTARSASRAVERFEAGEIDLEGIARATGFEPEPPATWYVAGTLWQYVPFYETVLLKVNPVADEDLFASIHGFAPTRENVEEVLDLVDDGRVVPVIEGTPAVVRAKTTDLKFGGANEQIVEFCERVLDRRPPTYVSGRTFTLLRLRNDHQREAEAYWAEAADTLGLDYSFADLVDDEEGERRLDRYHAVNHVLLSSLGYHDLAGRLLDGIDRYRPEGRRQQTTAAKFLVEPAIEAYVDQYPVHVGSAPFGGDARAAGSTAGGLSHRLDPDVLDRIEFPCEVGQYLFEEWFPRLTTKQAALTLYDSLRSQDMHEYVRGLTTAIAEGDPDDVFAAVDELDAIGDQLWDDVDRIARTEERTLTATRVGVGAAGAGVGVALAGPAGGAAGLLATLGVELLDDQLRAATERLVTWREPNHAVTVYRAEKRFDDVLMDRGDG